MLLKVAMPVLKATNPPAYVRSAREPCTASLRCRLLTLFPPILLPVVSCLVVVDSNEDCVALSLYHLNEEACAKFSDRDTLIVMDPVIKNIRFTHGGKVQPLLCSV